MASREMSMIERMGGAEAASGLLISAVELFYDKLTTDPDLITFFEGVDTALLKRKQIDFLAYVFGGPHEYSGKGIFEAHERLIREKGLNEKHFDIVANHFRNTLTELGASQDLVDEAVNILASARPVFEHANYDRQIQEAVARRSPRTSAGAPPSPSDHHHRPSSPAAAPSHGGCPVSHHSSAAPAPKQPPQPQPQHLQGGGGGGCPMHLSSLSDSGGHLLPLDESRIPLVAGELHSLLQAKDAELERTRASVRGLVRGASPKTIERVRAALRLRSTGLVDLFDRALLEEASLR